ncbi:MAG: PPC domain-containing protein [Planctomycetes bacterium]|nr:PPC domain-containing protein [Planctomycetota bacterium]MCH9725786.1 PPC domain-containing protein [Planctomycetota bacterium]MCH9777841.1 PPC domain-containing protein [Planctomycetota bacterium]MCH9791016.1 PPC domain-containing protein [Planctomycetota bacterium]
MSSTARILSTVVSMSLVFSLITQVTAAPPSVRYLNPAGGQVGQKVNVTVDKTLGTAPVSVWTSAPGLKVVIPEKPAKGKEKQFSIQIDAKARPGLYWLRFHNAEGASGIRPFVVGTLPEQSETEPNNDLAHAQKYKQPSVTINGVLSKSGDVDTYQVVLKKGETLVASLTANEQLGSPMDGVLQILNHRGTVLSHIDDTLWFDPRIVFTAPADGTYYIRTFAFPADPNSTIRFAGAASYVYRLTLSTGPFVDHSLPLAHHYETAKPVTLEGWNLTDSLKSLRPVAEHSDDKALVSHPQLANWLKIPLSPHPVLLESKQSQQEKGQLLSTPSSVTGKISESEEIDVYRFNAKKGESLTFQVDSHALGYPLDAHLKLFDAKGKLLKEIDDPIRNYFDARLIYKIPADGEYQLHVTDRFQHGGFRYVYLLTIEPTTTDFKLQTSAEQYTLTTGGKPLEIEVTINRLSPRFSDDIEISLVGLPKGVTCKPIISKVKEKTEKSVKLKLEAKPDTVFQGPLEIKGTSLKDKTKTHLATAVIKGISPKRNTARPKPDLQLPYLWLTIKKKK